MSQSPRSLPTGLLLSETDLSQKSSSLFDIEADSSFGNTVSVSAGPRDGHGDALNALKSSHSDIYDSIGERIAHRKGI